MDNATPDADAFLAQYQGTQSSSDTPDADLFLDQYKARPSLSDGLSQAIAKENPPKKDEGIMDKYVYPFMLKELGVGLGAKNGIENASLGAIQTAEDIGSKFIDTLGYHSDYLDKVSKDTNNAIDANRNSMFKFLPGYQTSEKIGEVAPLIAVGTELVPFDLGRGALPFAKNIVSATEGSAAAGALEPESRDNVNGPIHDLESKIGTAGESGGFGGVAQAALGTAGKLAKTVFNIFKPYDYESGDIAQKALNRFNGAIHGTGVDGNGVDVDSALINAAADNKPLTSAQATGDVGLLGAEQGIKGTAEFSAKQSENQRARAQMLLDWGDKSSTEKLLDFAKMDTNQQLNLADATQRSIDEAISKNKLALLTTAKTMVNDPRAQELFEKYDVQPQDIASMANDNASPTKPEFAQKFFDLLYNRASELRNFKNATYDKWTSLAPHEMITPSNSVRMVENLSKANDRVTADAVNQSSVSKYLSELRDPDTGQISPIPLSAANNYLKQLNSDINTYSRKVVPGEQGKISPYNTVQVLTDLRDSLETSIRNTVKRSSNPDLRAAYRQADPVFKEYAAKVLNINTGVGRIAAPTKSIFEQISSGQLIPPNVLKEQYFTGNPTNDDIAMKQLNGLFTNTKKTKLPLSDSSDLTNIHNQITNYGISDLKDAMGNEPTLDKMNVWMHKNSGVINNVPELRDAVNGLATKFDQSRGNYKGFTDAIGQTQDLLKARKEAINSSQLMQIVNKSKGISGGVDTDSPVNYVGQLLKSPDATGFNALVDEIGNNGNAREGLKSSIAQWISNSSLKETAQGVVPNDNSVRKMLSEFNPVFKKMAGSGLYTDGELKPLYDVKDLIEKAYAGRDAGLAKLQTTSGTDMSAITSRIPAHNVITDVVKSIYNSVKTKQQADTAFVKMMVDPKEAIRLKAVAEQPTHAGIVGFVSDLTGIEGSEQKQQNIEPEPVGKSGEKLSDIDPYILNKNIKALRSNPSDEQKQKFDLLHRVPGAANWLLKQRQ